MKKPWTLLAAVMLLASPAARAANVTFTASPITGESNVNTVGLPVTATYFTGNTSTATNQLVNGVNFVPSFGLASGIGWTGSGTVAGYTGYLGSASAPFSSLSPEFQTVLSTAAFGGPSPPFTISVTALVVGHAYQVQLFFNDSRPQGAGHITTVTAGNSIDAAFNVPGVAGGLGTIINGTFVADVGFQTFGLSSWIDAYQLRDVTAVPEPSSLALLGFGAAGVAGAARRKRRLKTSGI